MAYSDSTKSNGSIRIAIDRMTLVICVLCLVLSLALVFAGGYLAGFNSRAALARATYRPEAAPLPLVVLDQMPLAPSSGLGQPPPAAPSSVSDQQPPEATTADASAEEETPPEATTIQDLVERFQNLAPAIETPPQDVGEDAVLAEAPVEEQADFEPQDRQALTQRRERVSPPEPVDPLPPEPVDSSPPPQRRPVAARPASGGYTVQVGAYSNKENADRMLAGVLSRGYRAEQVYTWYQPGKPVYCVWIDDYNDIDNARAAAAQYSEREGEDAVAVRRIIREDND